MSLFILTDFSIYLIFLISLIYKLWLCLENKRTFLFCKKLLFFSFSIFMCAFEDQFGDDDLKSIYNIAMSANVISI